MEAYEPKVWQELFAMLRKRLPLCWVFYICRYVPSCSGKL
jgi:hypothetical protein